MVTFLEAKSGAPQNVSDLKSHLDLILSANPFQRNNFDICRNTDNKPGTPVSYEERHLK